MTISADGSGNCEPNALPPSATAPSALNNAVQRSPDPAPPAGHDDVGITADESLARGLANRAIREAAALDEAQALSAFPKPLHARKGLRSLYRIHCNAIRKAFDGSIVCERGAGHGKRVETQFYIWGAENDRIVLRLISVPFRPIPFPILTFLEVTRHATERVFERLNTTDVYAVQQELTPCALLSIWLLYSQYSVKDAIRGVDVTTPNGKAIMNRRDREPWKVVTWYAAKPGELNTESEAEIAMFEEVHELLE